MSLKIYKCVILIRHYTSTKLWRGYIFTAACLCVCLSVCVCVSGNSCEQNYGRTDAPIWTRFSLNGSLATGSNPIEIGDLWSKVKVTVAQNSFFLHNSLLISLLYISALVYLINMKFSMRFDMPLADLYKNFIKIKWRMTSW